MTSKIYKLYCLMENGKRIRYFGITRQKPTIRMLSHIAEARTNDKSHKTNWFRNCLGNRTQIAMHVIRDHLTKARACKLERKMIRLFLAAFDLVNYQEGGQTGSPARPRIMGVITTEGILGKHKIELQAKSKKATHFIMTIDGDIKHKSISKRAVLRRISKQIAGKLI